MSGRFLTVEDLNRAGGKEVWVEEGTVVTPQAQEAARAAGITIRTQSGVWSEPTPDRGPDAERAIRTLPHMPEPERDGSLSATAVIVTVVGRNRAGVLAEVTNEIARHNANVEDITQKMAEDYFHLMFVVELPTGSDFDGFKSSLEGLAQGDYVVRAMHEKVFRFMHRV